MSGQEGQAVPAVDAVYFAVLSILIGLVTLTVARAWPRRWPALPIPFTAWMLGFGILFGLANEAGDSSGPISEACGRMRTAAWPAHLGCPA